MNKTLCCCTRFHKHEAPTLNLNTINIYVFNEFQSTKYIAHFPRGHIFAFPPAMKIKRVKQVYTAYFTMHKEDNVGN